jgi:hypothetical protein
VAGKLFKQRVEQGEYLGQGRLCLGRHLDQRGGVGCLLEVSEILAQLRVGIAQARFPQSMQVRPTAARETKVCAVEDVQLPAER